MPPTESLQKQGDVLIWCAVLQGQYVHSQYWTGYAWWHSVKVNVATKHNPIPGQKALFNWQKQQPRVSTFTGSLCSPSFHFSGHAAFDIEHAALFSSGRRFCKSKEGKHNICISSIQVICSCSVMVLAMLSSSTSSLLCYPESSSHLVWLCNFCTLSLIALHIFQCLSGNFGWHVTILQNIKLCHDFFVI